ncbi:MULTISPECIES: hypothetical protein [Rhodococcus]|uniref:hypothetical protein n=1 Tax=Rhodococcus TaxID=1827 RepID=UPI000AFA7EC5|nr:MULTISPECIES: hypothetical protein [Rhodococcus]MCZ4618573.1 hypothetical protein [Rhodococcus qingshengii]MEA1798458.1 hypothetical protein [Rhodococcus qingshengii]
MTGNRKTSYYPRSDPVELAKILFDELVGRYRDEKYRRNGAEASDEAPRCKGETEALLALALKWVPYGGVSEDEVFESYGISLADFIDRLWTIVRGQQSDQKFVAKLTAVYPETKMFASTSVGARHAR